MTKEMSGMMPLETFKAIVGLDKIQFLKGKGRQFVGTTMGTLFQAKDLDKKKPMYVTVAKGIETAKGESLDGTLWLVNSAVKNGDVL